MRFVFPEIDHCFDTECDGVNALIVENPLLLQHLLADISRQLGGLDGMSVVSSANRELPFSKNVELLDRFIPFEINQRPLLTKIANEISKRAVDGELYLNAMQVISDVEKLLIDASFNLSCNLDFSQLSVDSLIKASGFSVVDDYSSLSEKVIDYMELVTEFVGNKLFITYCMRNLISDSEADAFMKTALMHGFHLLMIETQEHSRTEHERRFIVDADLCEIDT